MPKNDKAKKKEIYLYNATIQLKNLFTSELSTI